MMNDMNLLSIIWKLYDSNQAVAGGTVAGEKNLQRMCAAMEHQQGEKHFFTLIKIVFQLSEIHIHGF